MNAGLRCLLLGGFTVWSGCRPTSASRTQAELSTREQRLATRLANVSESRTSAVARWILPREMREVSGLALTSDGRLLAHGDERGHVYVIDPRGGALLKSFGIGNRDADASADFEGITVAQGRIFMVASNGTLYEFAEGEDGERVAVTVHDTRLGHECEFEGLTYEADSAWFLMPCKNASGKKQKDEFVMYRWHLNGPDSTRLSRMTIPLDMIVSGQGFKDFRPTDITIDPFTHNYVLISSHEKALVELTPAGDVERVEKLPGRHNQPEGVAITKDGILIISDEENRAPAAITLYRWRP